MREKIHYAIEAALAVAVIILFVLQFRGNKKPSDTNVAFTNEGSDTEIMPIAFVDIDSLTLYYNYMIDLTEVITKDYENSRAKLAEQYRKLQSEYEDFQRKVETGSFLSRERAEGEAQRLTKKQEDLQKLEASYTQELDEKQFRLREKLRQTINVQLIEYNKSKGFHFIYGKFGDNMLYSNEIYNITTDVLDYLNRQYAADDTLKPSD